MDPIGSKVIEVKGQIYVVFFSVDHVFCLICLHRRNHLTATSRRVKFTSLSNDNYHFLIIRITNTVNLIFAILFAWCIWYKYFFSLSS